MLHPGNTFLYSGLRYRVVHVSELRAHCRAITTRHVTLTDRHGQTRTFIGTVNATLDISPNTPLEVLTELLTPAKHN